MYNDNPRDFKLVAVVDTWSLLRVRLQKLKSWPQNSGRSKQGSILGVEVVFYSGLTVLRHYLEIIHNIKRIRNNLRFGTSRSKFEALLPHLALTRLLQVPFAVLENLKKLFNLEFKTKVQILRSVWIKNSKIDYKLKTSVFDLNDLIRANEI